MPRFLRYFYEKKDGRWAKPVTLNGKRIFLYSSAKTERQTERDISHQMTEYTAKEEKGNLFEEAADEWVDEHSKKLAYSTAEKYKPHIKFAKQYFVEIYIKDITANDIKNFISYRIKLNYSQKTVQHTLSVVKMMFEYACINGLIRDNPCTYIKIPQNLPKTKRKRSINPRLPNTALIWYNYSNEIYGIDLNG